MDFPTKSQNSWEEIRANPAKARGVCSRTLHYSLDRSVPPPQPTSHSMPKLLALLATIKAILIVPAVMFAAGERVPVILISLLFNLTESGAKPVGQTVPQDIVIVSSNHDPAPDFLK
jgi:hypothetical protein